MDDSQVICFQSQGHVLKIIHVERLLEVGEFSSTQDVERISSEINEAIHKVVWPVSADKFTIYPESGKKRGQVPPLYVATTHNPGDLNKHSTSPE